MKKMKWESVLAIAIALTYGLIIGFWFGSFFNNTAVNDVEEIVVKEDDQSEETVITEEHMISDKNGIFDPAELRPIETIDSLDIEEIRADIDARLAYNEARLSALKVSGNQELYEILDDLSDSTDIKKFGKNAKVSKKHMNELKDAVKDLEDNDRRISFVALDLDYGFGISKGAQEVYYSASSLKGPYVGAAVSQMPDRANAYESTIYQVLKYSSNSGYEILRYGFGPDVISYWYEETGIDNLNKGEHYSDMTPVQLGKLWVRNWEFLTSGEGKADWLKPLYEGSLNSVMSGGLADEDTHVYSKAGWIAEASCGIVQNDGGIVAHDGEEPYLMVIMSSAYMQNDKLERVVTALDQVLRDMRKK